MGETVDQEVQSSAASDGKAPRTARGERTLRKILDAARDEFGEQGFSDSSIARTHRDVYRIIDEAEFVEPAAYREHYETTAKRIAARLKGAREKGEIAEELSDKDLDMISWGMMGANVFLGLKFAVWSSADPKRVAEVTSRLLRKGLGA
jgi:hypothetical protein